MSAQPSEDGARQPSALSRFLFVDTTFAGVLGILLILGGLFAYTAMVKESSPDLAIPVAMVRTEWPGAAPELIEKEVTTPIEKAVKSLNALDETVSGSRTGLSTIVVQFEADAPVDESIRALRTKVAEVAPLLPAGALSPTVEPLSTTDAPVLTYMLHGSVPDAVTGTVARDLKERLEHIGTLRKVEISGAREEVGRILLDPMRLNAGGVSLSAVRDAIAAATVDRPLGEMRDGPIPAAITLSGRFSDLEELRQLPVQQGRSGHVARLGDFAEIRRDLSTEEDRTLVSFGGAPFQKGVSISLYKMPGSDSLATIAQVKAVVDRFPLPAGMHATVLTDQSIDVSEKLHGVFVNAAQAVAGVVLVLLVMLSWREALIAGIAVPITFLASIATVYLLGMTMNEMVVIGMVLALGLLVDVFILVMEGMHRGLYAERRSFADSAMVTIKRFALSAFAGQLTTILALAPLMFLPGISGKFVRLVPTTAVICLVASYIIAFVWALPSSRLVFGERRRGDGVSRVDVLTDRAAGALGRWIRRLVVPSRGVAALWAVGTSAVCIGAFLLAAGLKFEMYPKIDGREMGITVELPPGTPLERSTEVGRAVGDVLRSKDYLQSIVLYAGRKSPFALGGTSEKITDTPGSHVIGYSVVFKPLDDRGGRLAYAYVSDLRREIQKTLAAVPGASVAMSVQTGGPSGGDDLRLEIQGEDLGVLRAAARDLSRVLAAVPGTRDVRDDLGPPRIAVVVFPNRDALEFFGLRLSPVAEEIALAMGETTVARLKRGIGQDDVPVRLSLAWPTRKPEAGPPRLWSELSMIRASADDGTRIDLPALFDAQYDSLPQVVVHKDGVRTTTVLGKAEDVTVGDALAAVEGGIRDIQARYPGVRIGIAGEQAEASETNASMLKMFVLTLVLMAGLLVLLFNSCRMPLIILFSVPCGVAGTVAGFAAIDMPLSFPATVGIVSLIGIVVNVAIVMIESIREHTAAGRSLPDAAAMGSADRLRPILSTTLTTVTGLALLSTSSPMWEPLCYAIMFGLVASTVLSFIVVPSLFLLLSPRTAN